MIDILTGKQAEKACDKILAAGLNDLYEWSEPYVAGYFKERNLWLAFDNITKNCWIEEFPTKLQAKQWCKES